MGKTFIGMSCRHLIPRAREHLNHNDSRKRVIKDYFLQRKSYSQSEINLPSSFAILKKCSSEHNRKIIYKALLTTRSKPLFDKQLYANGCFFLLKIIYLS